MLIASRRAKALGSQIPKMANKMSKYSPADAKVLSVETMVRHCHRRFETGD